jgi:uncharacterized protein YndB with AHSA1/START domain
MPKAYTSTVIDLPADRVWAAVRDFNGLASWWPAAVTDSEIEEGKGGDQVGAVRSFHLKDGAHLRERLLSHSDVERSYSYNFEKTPFDVQNYHATLRVTPVTDGNKSFVEWWTTFDCPPEKSAEWIKTFSKDIFLGALGALKQHLGAK